MTIEKDFPAIPKEILLDPNKYQVIKTFNAEATILGKGKRGQETVKLGLIIPREPGLGDGTGFDMRLIKINEEGEFSPKGTDYMRLQDNGTFGFIVSGVGYPGIYLDKLDFIDWEIYEDMGMTNSVKKLIATLDKHRAELLSETPSQAAWEKAALDLAEPLARFFDYTPDN